jgi:hypothetical protein
MIDILKRDAQPNIPERRFPGGNPIGNIKKILF